MPRGRSGRTIPWGTPRATPARGTTGRGTWAGVAGNGSRGGRVGKAYREACTEVRRRAMQGEPCYFHGRPGYEACPGGWDWTLPTNHPWAHTAHHLHRIMDGGTPTPDPAQMAPAHRSCNAADGLRAQNNRRAKRKQADTYAPVSMYTARSQQRERTSRGW